MTRLKLKSFQNRYNEAIETINQYLKGPESMKELTHWLMTTDASSYCYLNDNWAGMTETAEGMAVLLNCIHHAIVDDGDITFVKVNGEPRIVFAHKFDDNFRETVLGQRGILSEKRYIARGLGPFQIEVLDIKPNEFGKVYDEYQSFWIKKCFMDTARCHGVEVAKQRYKEYKCWDESWADEVIIVDKV